MRSKVTPRMPVFGAPPSDLSKSSIGDFFRAASFAPVLSEKFLDPYKGTQPQWGPIGYVAYKRTYARPLYPTDLGYPVLVTLTTEQELTDAAVALGYEADLPFLQASLKLDPTGIHFYSGAKGQAFHDWTVVRTEEYWETLSRVLNGLWHILRCHAARKCIEFSEQTAQRKAEQMFERMWAFKWLPPGRGLWMMGTRFAYLKGSAALMNCGYHSTEHIDRDGSKAFAWIMDMSMLGVGPGFDTRGAGKALVKTPPNLTPVTLGGTLPPGYAVKERLIKTKWKLPRRQSTTKLTEGKPAKYYTESLEEWQTRIRTELAWALPKDTATTHHDMFLQEEFLVDVLFLKKQYITLECQRPPSTWRVGETSPIVTSQHHSIHVISDDREGWVRSTAFVLDAFLKGRPLPVFDYSVVRPKGTPIKGFGGVAEGSEFLEICHENLTTFFLDRLGQRLMSADITDICNEIGACVVSGNVRRSAQIGLGEATDEAFITLKHDQVNHPECWNSNNSVFGEIGMNYDRLAELIVTRGEPGIFWLENARGYGRMADPQNYRDKGIMGVNPCSEIGLENAEFCTLVENFPAYCANSDDFQETLKQSYLYAKAVTLVPCHNKDSNRVMGKNSRIGCSVSGMQQARVKFGTRPFLQMLDQGYKFLRELDTEYSDWLQVRNSIKITTCKPSGTVALLPGATPGIHYAISPFYLRRIRFAKGSPIVPILRAAGYRVYDAPEQPKSTDVVDFPVATEFIGMTEKQASQSIWEQLEFCAQVQALWTDNQVSITVKFDPTQAHIQEQIARALELYETRLKSISFLAHFEPPAAIGEDEEDENILMYKAAPYQPITREQYERECAGLRPYRLDTGTEEILVEGCDSGVCPVR